MDELRLGPHEARVLGALAEKAITTPQYYPMTVNALMLASNQKNCRHPVMALNEGDTGAALNRLEELGLCRRDDRSGRVPKWRHNFRTHLLLESDAFALLVTLMLRGAQTLSELRANASGLGGPDDAEAAQALLKDLSDRAQPLVVLLPKSPGRKEARYAHSLCGVPESDDELVPAAAAARPANAAVAALEERLAALEARVAQLEGRPAPADPNGNNA